MKTNEYRSGYLADHRASKNGSQPNDDVLGPLVHARLDNERRVVLDRCLEIIESYQIPAGNSCSGELAAEWTYNALREIRNQIKELKF